MCDMRQVTTIEEFESILKENKNVFVDFYADWCGPCKMIAPVVEGLERENPHIVFVKINVDEAQNLTRKYGVSAMPTFMGFINGVKDNEVMGADPAGIKRIISFLK